MKVTESSQQELTKQNVGFSFISKEGGAHLFECQVLVVYQILWKYNLVDLRYIGKNLETRKGKRDNRKQIKKQIWKSCWELGSWVKLLRGILLKYTKIEKKRVMETT